MAAKYIITQDRKKLFHFNLKTTTGEILATSENGYGDRKSCLKEIKALQKEIVKLQKIITTAKIVDETMNAESIKKSVHSKAKTAPKKNASKKATTPKEAPKKRGRKPKAK
ncbi:hypothetical protein FACS1894110_13940 [Spirochaetia bacterium]|nr:hypothetical protein FACS1894110_13940 [Spirochaetia bacterium]